MFGIVLGFILKLAGSSVVDKAFGYLEKKAESETERQRIQATRETALAGYSRDVITAGMGHRMFWVAWSVATLMSVGWYAYAMADTLLNGALPDTASIPPGLKPYFDIVWSNIFYTGAGMAGAEVVGKAIAAKRK